MKYSAIHKKIIIDKPDLDRAIEGFLWSMKKYRKVSNIPLGKRKSDGSLTDFDQAEREMIMSLKTIGIDMGTDWGHELDLTTPE